MTTYPPGQISRYGQQLVAQGIDPHITLVSPGGEHIFYLSGPLAPMPGCQPGVVLTKGVQGLHPAFNHLDYRGARQDGVTYADTVYDPAEMILDVEASGRTAAETREVVRNLIAALDPKKQCTLSWFTPEYGEWWCKPRLFRAPGETITQSPARHKRLPLKLSLRNDDAFWRSQDSVSTFYFSAPVADVSDDFTRADNSATDGLGANWTQQYTGNGALGIEDNDASWYESGTTAGDCRAFYVTESNTDYQAVSIVLGKWLQYPQSGGHLDILGRVGAGGDSYIRARITATEISLAAISSGAVVWSVTKPALDLNITAFGKRMTLICGTSTTTPRQHRLLGANGWEILSGTDPGVSHMGSGYRGWGFGMGAEDGSPTQDPPPQRIESWYASDNQELITNNGFLPLTNRGTEDVHPVYICYGPGTFYIGNGSGSVGAANPVVFGPLNPGQVAMIDTDPRRKGVVDISPGQGPAPTSLQQQVLDSLTSLVFAGNVGPLINTFKSFFGLLPPQGPLYSKLTGRFTRPIAGHVDGTPLVTEQVAVTIVNGNAASRIVGAITPLRRWPE